MARNYMACLSEMNGDDADREVIRANSVNEAMQLAIDWAAGRFQDGQERQARVWVERGHFIVAERFVMLSEEGWIMSASEVDSSHEAETDRAIERVVQAKQRDPNSEA